MSEAYLTPSPFRIYFVRLQRAQSRHLTIDYHTGRLCFRLKRPNVKLGLQQSSFSPQSWCSHLLTTFICLLHLLEANVYWPETKLVSKRYSLGIPRSHCPGTLCYQAVSL